MRGEQRVVSVHQHFLFVATALVIFLLYLLFPHQAFAATYTVTRTDDPAPAGSCDVDDCSLREAVDAANGGGEDSIVVPAGTYTLVINGSIGDGDATTGGLDFTDTDTTTVIGAGSGSTFIDGGGSDGIHDGVMAMLTGASVDMSGVTIQNGYTNASAGAGLYMYSAAVVLDDVIIQDNHIDGTDGGLEVYSNGAGLFVSGTDLTMTNSSVRNNGGDTEALFGGGMYIGTNGTVSLDTVVFSGNATGVWGGAIFAELDDIDIYTFTNVTFRNNEAVAGGALYVSGISSDEPMIIHNANFTGNVGTAGGGAGWFQGPVNITNASFHGNSTDVDGGAFAAHSSGGVVNVAFSTITANFADADDDGSGHGGGIWLSDLSSAPSVTLHGVILAENFEGDPDASSSSWTDNDCYEADQGDDAFTSMNYSLLSEDANCSAASGSNNDIEEGSGSHFFTAEPEAYGGLVDVIAAYLEGYVIDQVPEVACLDAEGNALTEDARGYTRPENTDCDMGAFEFDQTDPVISITSGTDTIECGVDSWIDAGATITDNFKSGLVITTIFGSVTTTIPAVYPIIYSSTNTDFDGNSAPAAGRYVTVQDTIDPVVTLVGGAALTLAVGDTYSEQGATVTDSCDDDIEAIVSGDVVDTGSIGEYTLTYTATDSEGNVGTTTRTIVVEAAEDSEEGDDSDGPEESTPVVKTDGRYVRVWLNGELVSQKKINSKKIKKKFRKVKVGKLYTAKEYSTIATVIAKKNKAVLTVFRLTADNELTKKSRAAFDIQNRNKLTLKFKPKKKYLVVSVGSSSDERVVKKFKLTKKGILKEVE